MLILTLTQLVVWIASVLEVIALVLFLGKMLKQGCLRFYLYILIAYSFWCLFQFLSALTKKFNLFLSERYYRILCNFSFNSVFSAYLESEYIFNSKSIIDFILATIVISYLFFGGTTFVTVMHFSTGDSVFVIHSIPYKLLESVFFIYGFSYFISVLHFHEKAVTAANRKNFARTTIYMTISLIGALGVILLVRSFLSASTHVALVANILFFVLPQLQIVIMFYLSHKDKVLFCFYLFDIYQIVVYDSGGVLLFSYNFAKSHQPDGAIVSGLLSALNIAMSTVVGANKPFSFQKIISSNRTVFLVHDAETDLFFGMILNKPTNFAEERFKYFIKRFKQRYKEIKADSKDTYTLSKKQLDKLRDSIDIVQDAFSYYPFQ